MKNFLAMLGTLFLIACSGGSMQTTQAIVASGWAQPPAPYNPNPVYCYKTLASIDCYPEKILNADHRLVAFYPQKPRDKLVQSPPSVNSSLSDGSSNLHMAPFSQSSIEVEPLN